MKEKIKGTVTMGTRVTALAIQPENPNHIVEVSVAGHEKPRKFNHVITTLPFGCLRNVDTSGCFFSWDLQTAIRFLRYDCSTKVAIQFSSRWWEQDNLKQWRWCIQHRPSHLQSYLPILWNEQERGSYDNRYLHVVSGCCSYGVACAGT